MSCEQNSPVVGIIMGSESDMPAMEPCMKQLDEFGVPYEVKVASAHRKPAEVHEWASSAHERGIRVIVAAAGRTRPSWPCKSSAPAATPTVRRSSTSSEAWPTRRRRPARAVAACGRMRPASGRVVSLERLRCHVSVTLDSR